MSEYANRHIVVAGGAGLIGQNLIPRLLAQGAIVTATQHRTPIEIRHPNLQIVSCDLRDETAATAIFRDAEIAFLTAARVKGAKQIKEDPSSLILYNLELHARLFHCAVAAGVRRCAHISSSYVYPHTGQPNIEDEAFVGEPPSAIYGLGWMHRYLETLCRHFHETTETDFAIIRPTAYYGPHDNVDPASCHVIPALILRSLRGDDPFEVWGTGDVVRCFTYVADVVDGLLTVTAKAATARPYNICADASHRIVDVVSTLHDVMGIQPTVRFDPTKPTTIPYKVSNPSRAREELGWVSATSLRDGLIRTVEWMQEGTNAKLTTL